MENFDQVPEQSLSWIQSGKDVAIATVVETWGSAPRPVGAMLAIQDNADFVGSVSGGCVEGAVVVEALDALQDGKSRLLEYKVEDENAFSVGLTCGGTIKVLVEPLDKGNGPTIAHLEEIVELRAAEIPFVTMTNLETWERNIARDKSDIADNLRKGRSELVDGMFQHLHVAPPKLIVIGGAHIAQSLLPLAQSLGWSVTLVDPRPAFANTARFPTQSIHCDWPELTLPELGVDERTAIVTLSHDAKIDDQAIKFALQSDAFYLGCLGSSRTHAKRLKRLNEAGIDAEKTARIHAPVGVNIGASTPAEIAVSIMAEITERFRRPESRP